MHVAGVSVAGLAWLFVAIMVAQDANADPSAVFLSADPARQRQIFEEALGVKVVVQERDELPEPDLLAEKISGGLRVTAVVGALAKAATLEPGDTIVRIGDTTVTDMETALAGVREPRAQNWITIQVLRGNSIRNIELLLAPQFTAGVHPGLPWPDRIALAGFAQAESVRQLYRQKCQLLAEELQEIERLQYVLGVEDISDPPSIVREKEQREEQLLAQNALRAQQLEAQLVTLNGMIKRLGQATDKPDAPQLRALLDKQTALTSFLTEVVKQRDDAPARLESFRQDVHSLASRHERVRLLVRAVEGLRGIPRQGTSEEADTRRRCPAPN